MRLISGERFSQAIGSKDDLITKFVPMDGTVEKFWLFFQQRGKYTGELTSY